MRTPFFGQAYVERSTNLAANQLINLYPVMAPSAKGESKDVGAFYNTPGLALLATVGNGPLRGVISSPDGNTLYVTSGNRVYSLSNTFSQTTLGNILSSSGPLSMIANATQLAVFDGAGYISSGGSLSQLSLPFPAAGVAGISDGFGIITQGGGSQNWWQSNLGDLSTWNAANFSQADADSDPLISLAVLNREIFLFKRRTTEVWINNGNLGFVFSRLDGPYIEVGIVAPYSVAKCVDTLAWLGQSEEGFGAVYALNGYKAEKISTPAVDYAIAQYTTISDAIAFCYMQEGHLFYELTFPTAQATWDYDFTTKLWHQRAAFSNGALIRDRANCCAAFQGQIIVGDYQNGNLYARDLNTYTDNGSPRKWLRSWRALAKPANQPVSFSSLQIDMQTGVNVPAGANPQVMLRVSDDGGHNWKITRMASAGPAGATAQRVRFTRLGSTRLNSGLDRIFELSSTDQFAVALIGAELE